MKILLADDDGTNRRILHRLLSSEGYDVIQAENGRQAVDAFNEQAPDLIILDVLMPEMDGYEAARLIKGDAQERFVPIIFLTALDDSETLEKCIQSGGDDFLTKPYSRIVLRSKIIAMRRIAEMNTTMRLQRDKILVHQDHLEHERTVAERVFKRFLPMGCLSDPSIQYMLSPMSMFNGDLLLAAYTPTGSLQILVGDFTGHGLPAAMGAIPVSDIFYAMVHKGFALTGLVGELNKKLCAILPPQIFLAATLLEFSLQGDSVLIWNGGNPDVLVVGSDGQLRHRVCSQSFALGIVDTQAFNHQVTRVYTGSDDRVYAYSDGVVEATNPAGELFGQERLESVFKQEKKPQRWFDAIGQALKKFTAGGKQVDDTTLIEVCCSKVMEASEHKQSVTGVVTQSPTCWSARLMLDVQTLCRADPVPVVMHVLTEIQGLAAQREQLFMVVAELYSNALEHGLLALDSNLKKDPEGFAVYYRLRQERLDKLQAGHIVFDMKHEPQGDGGCLTLRIEDSGPGFDFTSVMSTLKGNTSYSGRGLALVQSLCRRVEFSTPGNVVTVEYDYD